ncbi:NACHT and WD40 repeat domain-containing protein [Streptomyces sp. NPDC020951]|uniref:NACHT and WD40 repeat domain-containing protein n=1 Tax=Streptomyces sp. NPDC020951 TaxID=3365104 RepID=UPI0037B16671
MAVVIRPGDSGLMPVSGQSWHATLSCMFWSSLDSHRRRQVVRNVVLAGLGLALVLVPLWLMQDGIDKKDIIGILLGILALAVAVADYLRGDSGRPLSSTAQADDLAGTVQGQWTEEARARRLRDPRVLPLTWTTAEPAVQSTADRSIRLRLGGRLDGDFDSMTARLADGYRQLPKGRLVAIGEPGSGKTVLAILLTLGLLGRRSAGEPVPVLLAASSWDPISESLDDWIVRTLADTYYRGRPDIPRALLDQGLLTPILDGLDEIPESSRRGAVRAINHALGAERPIVVTCRAVEYTDVIEAGSPTLRRAPVIQVAPLAAADTIAYLEDVDWPDPATHWSRVYDHLRTGPPDAPVCAALSTPLMVSQARLIYQRLGGSPAELLDLSRFDSRHAIEDYLLDRLIDAAYAPDRLPSGRPTGEPPRWEAVEAHRWLTYLAQYLHQHRERDLAWWQLGQRLLSPWAAPAVGLVLGTTLMVVLSVWLANLKLWSASYGYSSSKDNEEVVLSAFTVSALAGAGMAVLVVIVWYATPGRTPGQLSFNLYGSLRRLRQGAATGMAVAAVPAAPIVLGQAVSVSLSDQNWSMSASVDFFELLGMVCALAVMAGLAIAIHNWLTAQPERAAQATPNHLLRHDRNSSLLGALAAGTVIALTAGAALVPVLVASDLFTTTLLGWSGEPLPSDIAAFQEDRLHFDLRRFVIIETSGILPGSTCAVLIFLSRAWPRFRLAAVLLAVQGRLPWRLFGFLSDARRRGVLRQSGGAFQFRHIRLQERLNDQPSQPWLQTRFRRRAIIVAAGIMAIASTALVVALPDDVSRSTILVPGMTDDDVSMEPALSPNGRWLLYAPLRRGRNGYTGQNGAWMLDLASKSRQATNRRVHGILESSYHQLVVSGDGSSISVTENGGTSVWSVKFDKESKLRCAVEYEYDFETTFSAISPDGSKLAVSSVSSEGRRVLTRVWDLAACQKDPIHELPYKDLATKLEIASLAFDPTAQVLAASFIDNEGRGSSIELWDLTKKQPTRRILPGHRRALHSLALSRNGRNIALQGSESTYIWNASSCKAYCDIGRQELYAFSDNGHMLATSSGDEIRLWDAENGKLLEHGAPLEAEGVFRLTFGPGSHTLTTLHSDGMVKKWEVP